MIGTLSLDEWCEISPGENWYLFGLWLGIEDRILHQIKKYNSEIHNNMIVMFEKYLEKSYKTKEYFSMQLSSELKHEVNHFFSQDYSTQVVNLREIKQKIGASDKHFDKSFQKQQENRRGMKKNVLMALIRADLTEEAKKFCSTHGENDILST